MKKAVALLLSVVLCVLVVACTQNTTDVTPQYETEYKLHDGKKAIVVLPGLLASGLWDADTKEPLWDPIKTDDVDMLEFVGAYDETHQAISVKNIMKEILPLMQIVAQTLFDEEDEDGKPMGILQRMMCDENGEPIYNVQGVPVDYEGHLRYGALNSYKWVAQGLQQQFGDQYEVVVFNYNWVTDTRAAARDLSAFMQKNNYTDSILIGHSMGGIVASEYLAMCAENRARVDKFISVATPFYGSYSVNNVFDSAFAMQQLMHTGFATISQEYGMDLSGFEAVADAFYVDTAIPFLFNMKSMYQLLPSAELIQLQMQDDNAGVFENGQKIQAERLYEWYCTRPWATDDPLEVQDLPPRAIFADWQAYRDAFYVPKPEGNVFVGDLVDTYYVAADECYTYVGYDIVDNTLYLKASNQGDGTVPLLSATRGQQVDNRHVFCVHGEGHIAMGCLWDSEQGRVITSIIKGE